MTSHAAAVANLGDFALACDSINALFRCAAATIVDQLGVDCSTVTQTTENGGVVLASSGTGERDLIHGLTIPIV